MKFLLVLTFYFAFCCDDIFGLELPSFMQKCSLKDPNLNECIKEKANLAIPNLIKGLKEYGIPVMSPIRVPEIKLGGKNLPIVLTDVYTDDLKKIRLTEVLFDLKTKRGEFTALIDQLTLTATYTITDGKILTRTVSGTGKFNMTLVGNTIQFKCKTSTPERGGEKYLSHTDMSLGLQTDRAYYSFENLKSSDGGGDIAEFVNEQWKVIRDELKPTVEDFLLQFIYAQLEGIGKKVPLMKLFL